MNRFKIEVVDWNVSGNGSFWVDCTLSEDGDFLEVVRVFLRANAQDGSAENFEYDLEYNYFDEEDQEDIFYSLVDTVVAHKSVMNAFENHDFESY